MTLKLFLDKYWLQSTIIVSHIVTVVVEVIGGVLDGPVVGIVAVVLSEQIRKNGNSDPNNVVVLGTDVLFEDIDDV